MKNLTVSREQGYGEEKKEHIVFDRIERIKKNINKRDYNQKMPLPINGNGADQKNPAKQKAWYPEWNSLCLYDR